MALALASVATFSGVCISLLRLGFLDVASKPFYVFLGVWSMGIVALLFTEFSRLWINGGLLAFVKALWCNLGVVCMALFVPYSVRVLLLVIPLFGVLFTALHLDRRRTIAVAVSTWATYMIGAFASGKVAPFMSTSLEGVLLVAFTVMLLVMLYMADEVAALRGAFARRQQRLNDAMERLADLAMRDELTGLYNRRYIMDVLKQQKALADRGHVGFTLLYCDLDHFKKVNDQYGHGLGDRVLRDFGALACDVVRSVDYVARFGGEEFLLVLVGADEDKAVSVAERLGASTRQLVIDESDPGCRLTVSTGIASFRPGERLEDVIQRADSALYRAKTGGRDQIVVAG